MSLICACPREGAITSIPNQDCKFRVGQIQRAAFERLYIEDGDENFFPMTGATGAVGQLASWTAKIAATDNTKIQITPEISNPTTTPGEAITFGGGNATANGTTRIIGTNPTTFTGELHEVDQSVIAALKDYMCELDNDLGVYLFVPGNGIVGIERATEPGGSTMGLYPIPIRSLFIGDLTFGGYDGVDMNAIQWEMSPNWSDNLTVVQATFNPLSLRNA